MDSTFSLFTMLKNSTINAAAWFNKAIDINHSGLFDALDKGNWPKIASAIHYPEVNKYAHDHNNAILFTAIIQGEYNLAKKLLTFENVKNDPSLHSNHPMLLAIASNNLDAVRFMLEYIPSIAEHVADDMNTVLINAVFNKQWTLVSELLMLPEVQNNFDRHNLQFIAQEMVSESTEIQGMMSHLLLSMPGVHDFLSDKIEAEKFRDLTDLSEGYATLVLGEEFVAERKSRNYAPSYPQQQTTFRQRKQTQNLENDPRVEELSEDNDISVQHANKRRRIGE